MNMNGIAVVISEVKLPSIRVILGRRFTTRRLRHYLFPTWDYCISTELDGSVQQSETAFKECCWATDWSPDKNNWWHCSKKHRAAVQSWAAPQDGNATLPSRHSGLFVVMRMEARVMRFHVKDFTLPSERRVVELASTVWLTSESEDKCAKASRHQGCGKVMGSAAV